MDSADGNPVLGVHGNGLLVFTEEPRVRDVLVTDRNRVPFEAKRRGVLEVFP